jgi:hypothetical protein
MKTHGRYFSLTVFAVALMLPLAACKSKSTADQNQQAQNQPQATPAPPQATPAPPQSTPDAATTGAASAPQTPPAATPRPPEAIELPTGTAIRVRLDQDLGSKISNPGDTFQATVADDVQVHGRTVIEKGARADGTVVDAKALGRFKGGASLAVKLDRVTTRWGSYPVETSSISRAEKGKGKRTGVMAGGGAGLGAIIGGLAGGGKGALIGGLAGAGAGTAGSAFTGNKEIVLPAETLLTFKLEHAVHVREDRR